MKAMIGGLTSMAVNSPTPTTHEPSMEFSVLFFEDDGALIGNQSINITFAASTNQNQLLPLAKDEVIKAARSFYGRTISTNDIKSAVLQ